MFTALFAPLLLSLIPAAGATDVLIPEATPRTLNDFAVASLFYEILLEEARAVGMELMDGDALTEALGDAAVACSDNPECPGNLWEPTQAKLAVVVIAARVEAGTQIDVRIYAPDSDTARRVVRKTVVSGEEAVFAAELVQIIQGMLAVLAIPTPVEPEPAPPPPTPTVSVVQTCDREAIAEHHLPDTLVEAYCDSGERATVWLDQERIRSHRTYIDIAAGYAVGAVNRSYGVDVAVEANTAGAFSTVGTATHEGATGGSAFAGWMAAGYAPTWFLDLSVAVGIQYGQKQLIASWACTDNCATGTAEGSDTQATQAVQGSIEPRLRLIPVATGPVKPYGLFGVSLQLYDGFNVPDPDWAEYPDTSLGAAVGPTFGAGMLVDALPNVAFFAEVPYTLLLATGAQEALTGRGAEVPAFDDQGWVLRVLLGTQVRL